MREIIDQMPRSQLGGEVSESSRTTAAVPRSPSHASPSGASAPRVKNKRQKNRSGPEGGPAAHNPVVVGEASVPVGGPFAAVPASNPPPPLDAARAAAYSLLDDDSVDSARRAPSGSVVSARNLRTTVSPGSSPLPRRQNSPAARSPSSPPSPYVEPFPPQFGQSHGIVPIVGTEGNGAYDVATPPVTGGSISPSGVRASPYSTDSRQRHRRQDSSTPSSSDLPDGDRFQSGTTGVPAASGNLAYMTRSPFPVPLPSLDLRDASGTAECSGLAWSEADGEASTRASTSARKAAPFRRESSPGGATVHTDGTVELSDDMRREAHLQKVLPNLRDMAASSGVPNMRPGVLFRAGRNFARNVPTLRKVMYEWLNIATVLDLREDDLRVAASDEQRSRVLMLRLYRLQIPPKPSRKQEKAYQALHSALKQERRREKRFNELREELERQHAASARASASANLQIDAEHHRLRQSHSSNHHHQNPPPLTLDGSRPRHAVAVHRPPPPPSSRSSDGRPPHAPEGEICGAPGDSVVDSRRPSGGAVRWRWGSTDFTAQQHEGLPPVVPLRAKDPWPASKANEMPYLSSLVPRGAVVVPSAVVERDEGEAAAKHQVSLSRGRKRWMYIVNYLDTEECHERIMNVVSNSGYLPLFAFYKATDKIFGSKYAPYYFCKHFINCHSLARSYEEMFFYCGERIAESMKIVTVAELPLLFHCTLGKDRTGILAALILHTLGAPDSVIAHDFALTQEADTSFKIFARKFIVDDSGLAEEFCNARPSDILDSLNAVRQKYGSIVRYLDHIGFSRPWRQRLRKRFLLGPLPAALPPAHDSSAETSSTAVAPLADLATATPRDHPLQSTARNGLAYGDAKRSRKGHSPNNNETSKTRHRAPQTVGTATLCAQPPAVSGAASHTLSQDVFIQQQPVDIVRSTKEAQAAEVVVRNTVHPVGTAEKSGKTKRSSNVSATEAGRKRQDAGGGGDIFSGQGGRESQRERSGARQQKATAPSTDQPKGPPQSSRNDVPWSSVRDETTTSGAMEVRSFNEEMDGRATECRVRGSGGRVGSFFSGEGDSSSRGSGERRGSGLLSSTEDPASEFAARSATGTQASLDRRLERRRRRSSELSNPEGVDLLTNAATDIESARQPSTEADAPTSSGKGKEVAEDVVVVRKSSAERLDLL